MGQLDLYPAGTSPAGFGPNAAGQPYIPPVLPVALRFDGATGDWVLDSRGSFYVCHPADQGVALALCIRRGSIKYAPNVGNTLHLVNLGAKDLRGQVEDAVRSAVPLASFLADGSIAIRRIEYEVRPHGGLVTRVTYSNFRLGTTATFPPPAP